MKSGSNEMLTFKDWSAMFRQMGNDFSKLGKKNKMVKPHQLHQPNYNNFPMWNYNYNSFGMMMQQQNPYHMMMTNNWRGINWPLYNNFYYGLGWPNSNYWMF